VDLSFLDQMQQHTVSLICAVINTVTQMGLQFPGTSGPGKKICEMNAQHGDAADSSIATRSQSG
jgi:hypothetical protein